METSPVEITDPSQVPAHQDRNFQSLIAAIEHSKIEVADLSAAALRGRCRWRPSPANENRPFRRSGQRLLEFCVLQSCFLETCRLVNARLPRPSQNANRSHLSANGRKITGYLFTGH